MNKDKNNKNENESLKIYKDFNPLTQNKLNDILDGGELQENNSEGFDYNSYLQEGKKKENDL